MRVLVAPDGFTGTLSAPEAARAVADGWLAARPGDEVDLCPLSDGGPGFLDVLETAASAAGGSRRVRVPVSGPLGEPTTADLLVLEGGVAGTTAVVETALACGAALLPAGEPRDALRATSAGVGHLLAATRTTGARRVLVGLGGSACTDGGAGALAVLGAATGADAARLDGGGGALARAAGAPSCAPADLAAALGDLAALRRAWEPVELVVASDVDVPLHGPHGAARGFAPQKGARPAEVAVLEEALRAWQAAVELADPACAGLADAPGAGAAGGLGYALAVLGGRRSAGAAAVSDAVGLAARLAGADVVVTGEGSLDWQSLRGKVVARVAQSARGAGVPVVAVAGQLRLAPGEAEAAGLDLAVAVAHDDASLAASLADPAAALSARVERVAGAWASRGSSAAPARPRA